MERIEELNNAVVVYSVRDMPRMPKVYVGAPIYTRRMADNHWVFDVTTRRVIGWTAPMQLNVTIPARLFLELDSSIKSADFSGILMRENYKVFSVVRDVTKCDVFKLDRSKVPHGNEMNAVCAYIESAMDRKVEECLVMVYDGTETTTFEPIVFQYVNKHGICEVSRTQKKVHVPLSAYVLDATVSNLIMSGKTLYDVTSQQKLWLRAEDLLGFMAYRDLEPFNQTIEHRGKTFKITIAYKKNQKPAAKGIVVKRPKILKRHRTNDPE